VTDNLKPPVNFTIKHSRKGMSVDEFTKLANIAQAVQLQADQNHISIKHAIFEPEDNLVHFGMVIDLSAQDNAQSDQNQEL